jgi:hypothetical protein
MPRHSTDIVAYSRGRNRRFDGFQPSNRSNKTSSFVYWTRIHMVLFHKAWIGWHLNLKVEIYITLVKVKGLLASIR